MMIVNHDYPNHNENKLEKINKKELKNKKK